MDCWPPLFGQERACIIVNWNSQKKRQMKTWWPFPEQTWHPNLAPLGDGQTAITWPNPPQLWQRSLDPLKLERVWIKYSNRKEIFPHETLGEVQRALMWPYPPQRWHDSLSRGLLFGSSKRSPSPLSKIYQLLQTISSQQPNPLDLTRFHFWCFPLRSQNTRSIQFSSNSITLFNINMNLLLSRSSLVQAFLVPHTPCTTLRQPSRSLPSRKSKQHEVTRRTLKRIWTAQKSIGYYYEETWNP